MEETSSDVTIRPRIYTRRPASARFSPWHQPVGKDSITVVISRMAFAHSKLTAQGQISVPAEVRRRLGVGPGSVLEWDESGEQVVVRKAGRHSSEDVHHAIFGTKPVASRSLAQLKDGIRRHIRKRHARR
jgi:antitoxin PrlF